MVFCAGTFAEIDNNTLRLVSLAWRPRTLQAIQIFFPAATITRSRSFPVRRFAGADIYSHILSCVKVAGSFAGISRKLDAAWYTWAKGKETLSEARIGHTRFSSEEAISVDNTSETIGQV